MSKHNPLTGVSPIITTALRSDQVDAPLIDDELQSHLLPRIKNLFRYIKLPQHFSTILDDESFGKYKEHMITYLVKSLSFLVTVGHGYPSPAMMALGLKLTTIPKGGGTNSSKSNSDNGQYPSHRRLFILFLGSIVLPCLEPILEDYVRINIDDDNNNNNNNNNNNRNNNISNHPQQRSSTTIIIANQRRRLVLQSILKIIPLLRLVNYITFLINPSSSQQPPTLSLRAAGITYDAHVLSPLTTDRPPPKRINYAYAQRRVLYAELFRCGKALLPSMGTWEELLRWRLWMSLLWSRRRRRRGGGGGGGGNGVVGVGNGGDDGITMNDNGDDDDYRCPICQNVPSIPYVSSSCHHVFCYVCLRYAIIDDPSYKCHLCGVTVRKSLPLKYDCTLA